MKQNNENNAIDKNRETHAGVEYGGGGYQILAEIKTQTHLIPYTEIVLLALANQLKPKVPVNFDKVQLPSDKLQQVTIERVHWCTKRGVRKIKPH